VVTAATALVPSSATILMCMKPTVVNNKFEMMLGQASCHTRRLVEEISFGAAEGKGFTRRLPCILTVVARTGASSQLLALLAAKTVHSMIIHHTGGLHMGVHDG